MKSLAKPRYTQEQYDQASAVYMRWCYEQALREGRPVPSKPARLPLLRPTYGREVAGVAKAISIHLGVSVHLIRFIFMVTTFFFGAGAIAYIFLWITIPQVIRSSRRTSSPAASPSRTRRCPAATPYGERKKRLHGQQVGKTSARNRQKPARWQTKCNPEDGRQSSESLEQMFANAPRPALLAMAGLAYAGPVRGDGGDRS